MSENYKSTQGLWDNSCMILSTEHFKFISFVVEGAEGIIAG